MTSFRLPPKVRPTLCIENRVLWGHCGIAFSCNFPAVFSTFPVEETARKGRGCFLQLSKNPCAHRAGGFRPNRVISAEKRHASRVPVCSFRLKTDLKWGSSWPSGFAVRPGIVSKSGSRLTAFWFRSVGLSRHEICDVSAEANTTEAGRHSPRKSRLYFIEPAFVAESEAPEVERRQSSEG